MAQAQGHGSREGTESPVVSLIRKYAGPCQVANKFEFRLLARVGEVVKHFLKRKAAAVISAAANSPILVSYSSDGTPLAAKRRYTAKVNEHISAQRSGMGTDEYLVQHAFYRYYDSQGLPHTAIVLRDPLPLTQGKTAMAIFSAAVEFMPTVREQGHSGITVSHYTFDRAYSSSLGKLFRQYHNHVVEKSAPSTPSASMLCHDKVRPLLDWVVSSACGLHDAHNSLKWSLHWHFNDTELIQKIHVAIESLRNSFDLLYTYLGGWIVDHLSIVDPAQLRPADELRAIWTTLGVEPEVVELLSADLRMTWTGTRLLVSATSFHQGGVVEKVSGALLSLWKFKRFTDSRWISVGISCRTLTAGLLSGLGSLVSRIRACPKASDFHIHGFERLTEEAIHFVVVASVSSYVSEGCLQELLGDSRVPMRLAFLKDCVQEEMAWLSALDGQVWTTLASVCHSVTGEKLRSDALAAGHISIAFLTNRMFNEAAKLPWSLAVGDQDHNLEELAQGPEPSEPTAAKIWKLLHIGFNRFAIKKALRLLLDCPWGTASAEQQHASATALRRHHPEYGTESLLLRSLVHTLRHILPGITESEQQEARHLNRLDALSRKNPQHVSGRHIYMKELSALAQDWKKEGKRKGLPTNAQRLIMKQHGSSWARMPPSEKKRYEAKAMVARATSEWNLQQAKEEAMAHLELARLRASTEKGYSPPLLLSSCRFSNTDCHTLTGLLDSPSFNDRAVEVMRKAAAVAPPVPSMAMQSILLQDHGAPGRDTGDRREWLSAICWQRQHFHGTALVFTEGEEKTYFKFLYATQSPLFLCCSVLEVEDFFLEPVVVTAKNWQDVALESFQHRFAADYSNVTAWHDLPAVPSYDIEVLPDLQYMGGTSVTSDSDLAPLPTFLARLPPRPAVAKSSGQHKPNVKKATREEALAQHPWLGGYMETLWPAKEKLVSTEPGAEPGPAEGSSEEEDDDATVEELFENLQDKREEWHTAAARGEVEDFRVVLLGGAWQQRTKGVAYDAFRGEAKGPEAHEWCAQYSLQKTARFEISLYGEHNAHLLAKTWCDKMQHFFWIWQAAGMRKYRYSAADRASYVEPEGFKALISSLEGRQLQRAMQLRTLAP